jgi:hypothetical protein
MNINGHIELLPFSARAKQLRKAHGKIWVLQTLPEPMQCFAGLDGVRITSLDGKHTRNVTVQDIRVI